MKLSGLALSFARPSYMFRGSGGLPHFIKRERPLPAIFPKPVQAAEKIMHAVIKTTSSAAITIKADISMNADRKAKAIEDIQGCSVATSTRLHWSKYRQV